MTLCSKQAPYNIRINNLNNFNLILILNLTFIRYWNRKLGKKVIISIVSVIWRKPVLTYAVSVVSLTASVNSVNVCKQMTSL